MPSPQTTTWPPSNWPAADQQEWGNLPPNLQHDLEQLPPDIVRGMVENIAAPPKPSGLPFGIDTTIANVGPGILGTVLAAVGAVLKALGSFIIAAVAGFVRVTGQLAGVHIVALLVAAAVVLVLFR